MNQGELDQKIKRISGVLIQKRSEIISAYRKALEARGMEFLRKSLTLK